MSPEGECLPCMPGGCLPSSRYSPGTICLLGLLGYRVCVHRIRPVSWCNPRASCSVSWFQTASFHCGHVISLFSFPLTGATDSPCKQVSSQKWLVKCYVTHSFIPPSTKSGQTVTSFILLASSGSLFVVWLFWWMLAPVFSWKSSQHSFRRLSTSVISVRR